MANPTQGWKIIRQGMQHLPPRVFYVGDEAGARRAWAKIDVRQGFAEMLRPDGSREMYVSGPFGVRSRW